MNLTRSQVVLHLHLAPVCEVFTACAKTTSNHPSLHCMVSTLGLIYLWMRIDKTSKYSRFSSLSFGCSRYHDAHLYLFEVYQGQKEGMDTI